MNRNLKGERFSREELIEMAVECGAIERSKIDRQMKTWEFRELTRSHRHAMFFRGEALLDTRPEPPKPPVKVEVDREVLAFLGVTL